MNTQLTGQEGYRGTYLERSGESAEVFVSALMSEPEYQLNTHDHLLAKEFESGMASAQLPGGWTIAETLRASSKADETKIAPLIFPHYILNQSVNVDGLDGLGSAKNANEIYAWFATEAAHNPSLALDIAKQTAEAYIATVAEKLASETAIIPQEYDAESRVIDPEALLGVASAARQARALLLEERSTYWGARNKEGVDGAKSAIVDVYLGRVNSDLASYIPSLVTLRDQAVLAGDIATAEKVTELIPRGMVRALNEAHTRQRLMRRLDFVRNGIGESVEGNASVVTQAVIESAQDAEFIEGAIFSQEQVETLKKTFVDPGQMKHIFEEILERASLLAGADAVAGAGDGTFKVLINPDKSTFAVNGINGEYKVASRPQSLYKIITVGGFHELQHINQSLADGRLGKDLQIAQLKGKRVSMLREGGANAIEREAEVRLFGYSKPISLTYAKALQVLEGGGSALGAITAFAQEKMRVVEGTNSLDAHKEAADRVLRMLRKGGLSSHVMAFAEEAILKREVAGLEPDAQRRAAAVTGLDLVDQVRLHRYGLLPPVGDGDIDWTPHIAAVMNPYIRQALGENQEQQGSLTVEATRKSIER